MDSSWAPIRFAVWFGHLITLLLALFGAFVAVRVLIGHWALSHLPLLVSPSNRKQPKKAAK
jgi:hypothetical protein